MSEVGNLECTRCGMPMVELWNGPNYSVELVELVRSNQVAIGSFTEFENLPLWVCLACNPCWQEVSEIILTSLEFERQFCDSDISKNNAASSVRLLERADSERGRATRIVRKLLKKQKGKSAWWKYGKTKKQN